MRKWLKKWIAAICKWTEEPGFGRFGGSKRYEGTGTDESGGCPGGGDGEFLQQSCAIQTWKSEA